MLEFRAIDGQVSIPLHQKSTLIVNKSKGVIIDGDARQCRWIYNFLDAPVGRWLHGLYNCPGIWSVGQDAKVTISSNNGKKLIHCYLPQSSKIAINLAYLVAFSKSVRIKTYGNFSAPAFASDLNIISVFEGPGDIVLETSGNHVHQGKGTPRFSPQALVEGTPRFSPGALVAWDPSIQFRLDNVDSVTDLYANAVRMSFLVDSKNKDLIIDNGFDAIRSVGINGFLKQAFSWIVPRI